MGLFDFIGNLVGFNQSNDASSASHSAHTYQNQAANPYANLTTQGNTQEGIYNNNFLSLLNSYGGLSGLGSPINPNAPKTTTPVSTVPAAGTGAPGAAPGQPGQVFPTQGNLAQNLNGHGNSQASNPYQLDQYQSQQLNQSMAYVSQSAKQATDAFTQQMANQGITDPRALQVGHQAISEHFADLGAKTQTAFYEQIKADKQQALQYLIQQISGYGQQGIAEQEASAAGFAGLSGAAANQSATNQQLSQQAVGNTLGAVGFGMGGGFDGPAKAAPAAAPATPAPPAPPLWSGPLSNDQLSQMFLGGF